MKIIAATKDGYILQATEDEIANLAGYQGRYDQRNYGERAGIGDTVNIGSMYRHLYELERESRALQNAASKLRTAADLIETLPDPITRAKAKPGIDVDLNPNSTAEEVATND